MSVFKTYLGNIKLHLFRHSIVISGAPSDYSKYTTAFTFISTDATPITKDDLINVLTCDGDFSNGTTGVMFDDSPGSNPPLICYPASIFIDYEDPDEDSYETLYALGNVNNTEMVIKYGYATTTDETYTISDIVKPV